MADDPPSDSDVEAAIAENVRLGYMELAGVGEDGEPRYRITPKGEQRIRKMMLDGQTNGFGGPTDDGLGYG